MRAKGVAIEKASMCSTVSGFGWDVTKIDSSRVVVELSGQDVATRQQRQIAGEGAIPSVKGPCLQNRLADAFDVTVRPTAEETPLVETLANDLR